MDILSANTEVISMAGVQVRMSGMQWAPAGDATVPAHLLQTWLPSSVPGRQ